MLFLCENLFRPLFFGLSRVNPVLCLFLPVAVRLLMVHTGRLHSPVINIHITLETSLMSLFIGLSRKKLVGDLCALEMYHQHLMSMVCATKTMLHYLILMLDSTTRQVDDHPNSPSGTFTFWTKRSK